MIEVDKGNQLVAEEDLTARVADLDLAQSDGESAQSLGETKVASAIGKPAVLLNPAHLEAGRVLDRAASSRERGSDWGDSGWRG